MTDKNKIAVSASTAAVTLGVITSLFIGSRYNAVNHSVQTDLADNYTTVLIVQGDNPSEGEIVYVAQDDETFDETEEFILRDIDTKGEYTMMLGGGKNGEPVLKKTFYITEDSKKTIIE